jgi:bacterioferritin
MSVEPLARNAELDDDDELIEGRPATHTERTAVEEEIPGPITRAYTADPKRVIERLNVLRSTEIVSYLQYKQHAYMVVSLVGPGLKGEFLEHAGQELEHADLLGERIAQLGGTPVYDLHEIAERAARQKVKAEMGQTVREMVMEDLEIERIQVERYTELIREIGEGDYVTRRMLEKILADSEHHAAEMRDLLQHRVQ